MKSSYLNLNKILDIGKWQMLQDSIALVTKMAIITVDSMGTPITTHSYPCRFCQFVRSQPELREYCFKCDSRGGLEAVRTNASYIYLCHCGIVDLAIPIAIDGKYVGAILAGEIRLPKDEENKLERILLSPSKGLFENSEVKQMYNEIPKATYAQVQQIAKMLFDMSNYIVKEAIHKNLILEMYGEIASLNQADNESAITNGYLPQAIHYVKSAIGGAITSAYIRHEKIPIPKNTVLYPAFEYIYSNKGASVTQKHMADLCHVSTSHFSKLFSKEIGEGFSNFISRLKVQWSKQLLEKTDLTISQISDEMGFSDTGYFIKTFKKYETITPTAYRKYYIEKETKQLQD